MFCKKQFNVVNVVNDVNPVNAVNAEFFTFQNKRLTVNLGEARSTTIFRRTKTAPAFSTYSGLQE